MVSEQLKNFISLQNGLRIRRNSIPSIAASGQLLRPKPALAHTRLVSEPVLAPKEESLKCEGINMK
ncbi:unnamed protein product [Cylicostephanus goldi]|uniref:Uncharacterized protein n=1 Tax=Cylicostephanus goldi TaxID=71465 RepID=A0A3P7LXU4_CYLGO|nr:unnamed protein product [Cylicostephanus goldi]